MFTKNDQNHQTNIKQIVRVVASELLDFFLTSTLSVDADASNAQA